MNLNKEQKIAVEHFDGPCIVTAIPGSGKTSTITSRVVHLIQEKHVAPRNILCLTFTNKAAAEMRSRIANALDDDSNNIWISTFHKLCISVLRKYGELVNLDKSFSIYNDKNQKELLSKIARMQDYESCTPGIIYNLAKTANDCRENLVGLDSYSLVPAEEDIIKEYLELLDEFNAVDFSGILHKTYQLLVKNPKIVEVLSGKFQHVLVDEMQDTNTIQYEIVKRIAKHSNLFVVGDFAQSIFAFRGAKPENMNLIKKDFDSVKEIVLHQNYRSTPQILELAQKLIRHNGHASNVVLTSNKKDGSDVVIKSMYHPEDEASSVTKAILMLRDRYGYKWEDFAVLYRTNSQSQTQEVSLRSADIPYRIVGGFSFFDRWEIKVALSYLSFMVNPCDSIAFSKAVAAPKRGIGDKWIGAIERLALDKEVSILEACDRSDDLKGMPQKTYQNLTKFITTIKKYQNSDLSLCDIVTGLLQDSGYYSYIEELSLQDDTHSKRLDNLNELLSNISEFEDGRPSGKVQDYLHSVELDITKDDNTDAVYLLTLHSSKGLEWENVFIIGAEEHIIPHRMSVREGNIEEERRLMYVGVSRSMKRLFISWCRNRKKFNFKSKKNVLFSCQPSRFIHEMTS